MANRRESPGSIAVALGPAAALLVAGALSGVRHDVGTTNVALILAMIVVLAAIAGRLAGVATAFMAAAAFNFFHTQPYRSLRISDGRDVLTVALLAGVGVVVSEIGERRRRASDDSKAHTRSEDALELVASRVASGSGPEVVWADVKAALVSALDLKTCRFVPADSGPVEDDDRGDGGLVVLPRSGSLFAKEMHWGSGGFVLPEAGAALTVSYAGRNFGNIVIAPRARVGSTIAARRMAIGLADQFAVALALASPADANLQEPATRS